MRRPVNSPYLARLERIEAAARALLPRIESDVHFESLFDDEEYGEFNPPKYGVFATANTWKALVEALKDE